MEEEMSSLKKNHTWELVDQPPGQKLVSCKWLYKIKEGIKRIVILSVDVVRLRRHFVHVCAPGTAAKRVCMKVTGPARNIMNTTEWICKWLCSIGMSQLQGILKYLPLEAICSMMFCIFTTEVELYQRLRKLLGKHLLKGNYLIESWSTKVSDCVNYDNQSAIHLSRNVNVSHEGDEAYHCDGYTFIREIVNLRD
ncbi:retrovirus-related pol polyprotein from transposon TNT 1-94 [Tanacetum coccineum]|uniref:Retrovirus-related pol polyprotein from transposon TNT 1-94 n=1 Tax=Tanacetum coccineum TaxID=301880 RepID=A0ABQ5F4L1_9ASTR